jgi:hypothetical protein
MPKLATVQRRASGVLSDRTYPLEWVELWVVSSSNLRYGFVNDCKQLRVDKMGI